MVTPHASSISASYILSNLSSAMVTKFREKRDMLEMNYLKQNSLQFHFVLLNAQSWVSVLILTIVGTDMGKGG